MLTDPKSCPINANHLNRSWNIRCNRQIFCQFKPFFSLLSLWRPRKSKFWKIEKLKKKNQKKTPEYITILQICTINDNHMMNLSWDMVRYRHNFLVILGSFFALCPVALLPFFALLTKKIKILKKCKKIPGDIVI